MRREYKSGTGINWCLWRWSDAQHPYLDRLFILKTPWFALCYIHIMKADVGDPHDHTASFLSVFLRGWYKERRIINGVDLGVVRRHRYNFIRATSWDTHRIVEVSPGGSHSICFMGPKRREWYYHTPQGMVHWATYKERYANEEVT